MNWDGVKNTEDFCDAVPSSTSYEIQSSGQHSVSSECICSNMKIEYLGCQYHLPDYLVISFYWSKVSYTHILLINHRIIFIKRIALKQTYLLVISVDIWPI